MIRLLEKQGVLPWNRALITDSLPEADMDILLGAAALHPERILAAVDHDAPAGNVQTAAKQRKLLEYARDRGIAFRYGQGIGYYLLMEDLAPGDIVICGGRRAATVGAVGAIGISLDAPGLKAALESGFVTMDAPVCRVRLTGTLNRHTSIPDLALQKISENRCTGALVAIHGPQLSLSQRITLCNLLGGAGVKSAFFVDELPDADVLYHLGEVRNLAVLPGGFEEIVPSARVDGLRVNQVFIGGCSGGSLDALRMTAGIWRGRQVCKYVRVMIAPATAGIFAQAMDEGIIDVLMDSGALIMNQGCSACWAQSVGRCDESEVFVTTGSINCANWAGKRHNGIYITSVERAAKAALTGTLYEN